MSEYTCGTDIFRHVEVQKDVIEATSKAQIQSMLRRNNSNLLTWGGLDSLMSIRSYFPLLSLFVPSSLEIRVLCDGAEHAGAAANEVSKRLQRDSCTCSRLTVIPRVLIHDSPEQMEPSYCKSVSIVFFC